MIYDELERFKVEADRWIACVTTDGSCGGAASQGLRMIIQQLHDQMLSSEAEESFEHGWNEALDHVATPMYDKVSRLERNGSMTTVSRELTEWLGIIGRLRMKRSTDKEESNGKT